MWKRGIRTWHRLAYISAFNSFLFSALASSLKKLEHQYILPYIPSSVKVSDAKKISFMKIK